MAIEKVDVGISDQDIFRSAMADEPTEIVVDGGSGGSDKPRDELGRFAPKADDAPVAATEQQPEQIKEPVVTQEKDEGQVPPWRLREMREERDAERQRTQDFERRLAQRDREFEALQRQVQQSQPKPEAPDFFANPDAAIDHRLNPIETQFNQLASKLVLRASKAEAYAEHGVAVVKEMEQAIGKAMQEQHPDMRALSAEMRNSDDPVGVAMNWYKRDKLLKETGGDIAGYRSKLEGDLLKDPAFLAKALDAARAQAGQPGKPSSVQIPPSLNKATGGAGNGAEEGDMSNESLWAAARPTGRRK